MRRIAATLMPLLAMTACQMPPADSRGRALSVEDQRVAEVAAAQTNLAADRFMGAYDRRGMSGVIEQIQECYRYATTVNRRPQVVRDCLVLDMTALRIDQQVSGGPPGGPQQLPFFRRATADARWARYAPLGNLMPGEDAGNYMFNASDAVLFEIARRRGTPVSR
jgi:hypothetical protein